MGVTIDAREWRDILLCVFKLSLATTAKCSVFHLSILAPETINISLEQMNLLISFAQDGIKMSSGIVLMSLVMFKKIVGST